MSDRVDRRKAPIPGTGSVPCRGGAGAIDPAYPTEDVEAVRAFLLPGLRRLRAGTDGWVWWDHQLGRRVFRPDPPATDPGGVR